MAASAPANEAEQLELFELLCRDFARTIDGRPPIDRSYRLGPGALRLSFAGEAMVANVVSALAHLPLAGDESPALAIRVWDRATTGRSPLLLSALMRSLSWNWHEHLGPRGEIRGFDGGRFGASFHPGPNILSLLDHHTGQGLYWVDDAAAVPWHETGSPLRTLLSWWAIRHDWLFVHAAAIGIETGAALVVGKGGSGKSTTALVCLRDGLTYFGDDYVLVASTPTPEVHSVYGTAKLKGPEDLRRFPELADAITKRQRGQDEKALLFLAGRHGKQLMPRSPLRVILVPRITPTGETTATPVGAGAALAALAPSTLMQLPGSDASSLRAMAALVRALPCFDLRLGTDIARIPGVIREVLEHPGS